ncbi:MAG TPA: carboxypeptidase-like regulatory domain-containing protein, partial [Blastocatellia bacterium]|nr:carboxypeptidase-like regulatory domain-containing protein [Blastocatellia bacterium]
MIRTVIFAASLFVAVLAPGPGWAQTASTGALAGTIFDPRGAVVSEATVTATNESTGETRSVLSGPDGSYRIALLPPGSYTVQVNRAGFKLATRTGVAVVVTEVTTLNVQLDVGETVESVTVEAGEELVQIQSVTLGRVTSEREVRDLPLVTRNYTQILGLSPGIITNVTNATELGRGSSGLSGAAGDVHANGGRTADNNFQMNGVQINDLAGAGSASGGVAIPNPDTIREFKVQTALYDAAFGRGGGANVNVVTKSGSNDFHGNLFHFFRNRALNANDFFFNLAGQPKPVLNQNQFGGTLGGPVRKDKLLFFTSYQGTRQRNGAAAGCSSSALLPPFTDDRSPAAIGALFAGRRGVFPTQFGVGPTIQADGSNINPVALKILQVKRPDGGYVIPTPQGLDPSRPLDSRGFAVFSDPCRFDEDQGMFNFDYIQSDRGTISGRYFIADSTQRVTMPAGSLPGFPQQMYQRFQNLTLSYNYSLSSNLFNELVVGFHRVASRVRQSSAFSYSSVGATVSSFYDDLPYIIISGCCNLGGGSPITHIQNTYTIQDSLSWVKGRHTIRLGGSVSRLQYNVRDFRFVGQLNFLSWPDFLMGLDAARNGTGPAPVPDFSNIIASVDFIGLSDRNWRVWEAAGYIQDDFKLFSRLTLNLGLRYERLGHLGEDQGRNAVFDTGRAVATPPAEGTLAGFVVSSNYPG